MNIHTQIMPVSISDERLDYLVELYSLVIHREKIILSFVKNKLISPAGMALLCNLLDAACEARCEIEVRDIDTGNSQHIQFSKLVEELKRSKSFLSSLKLQFENESSLNWFKVSSIAPEFIEKLNYKFSNVLTEDQKWTVSLLLNELMQNAVDHSTSERYFIYAGINQYDFEFGVIDRGVTIPAKLEVKYQIDNDQEFLKKSLEFEVGTRRNRKGGMGLYYFFEMLKDEKGKLVILSRDAQLRRHFAHKSAVSSDLKHRLYGTWCLARISLESKK
jgi:anti-sigma regulatory factor (Ser/Thr protein kinase)